VSPLLHDELRIALSSERVAMVRLGRGLRSDVVARHVVACAAPLPSEAPWAKTLESLEIGLRTMAGTKSDAMVVLSNHFVRYALVPWRYLISDKDEEQAFIRHCFTQTYGADAQHWALRLSPGGYGETQVACAIDQGLLDGLDRVAMAHGVRLVSLQPYFMTMFNQWCHRLQGSVVWFVVAEPGRLCVSLLKQGGWQILRTVKIGCDWQEALKKLLEREFLISESGMERGTVYLYAPGSAAAAELPGWAVHQLDKNLDAAPQSGIHFAMTMSE
jgi:hypothetical protein